METAKAQTSLHTSAICSKSSLFLNTAYNECCSQPAQICSLVIFTVYRYKVPFLYDMAIILVVLIVNPVLCL